MGVEEDVAHLAMELDLHRRCDLGITFYSIYMIQGKDEGKL
jgi:hypothetical protein